MRAAALMTVLICLALGVAGCGKKPDQVSPPQGEEADRFPRTYPSL